MGQESLDTLSLAVGSQTEQAPVPREHTLYWGWPFSNFPHDVLQQKALELEAARVGGMVAIILWLDASEGRV